MRPTVISIRLSMLSKSLQNCISYSDLVFTSFLLNLNSY